MSQRRVDTRAKDTSAASRERPMSHGNTVRQRCNFTELLRFLVEESAAIHGKKDEVRPGWERRSVAMPARWLAAGVQPIERETVTLHETNLHLRHRSFSPLGVLRVIKRQRRYKSWSGRHDRASSRRDRWHCRRWKRRELEFRNGRYVLLGRYGRKSSDFGGRAG